MKVQAKRAFKSYFFCHKKNKKKIRKVLYEILFNPQYKCAANLKNLFQRPFILLPPLNKYLNLKVMINKVVNEHSVDSQGRLSRLTSRIYHLIVLQLSQGFISCFPPFSDIYFPSPQLYQVSEGKPTHFNKRGGVHTTFNLRFNQVFKYTNSMKLFQSLYVLMMNL